MVAAWGRPHVDPKLHAIVAIGDSFVTACKGSWSTRDDAEIFLGPTTIQRPRCERCCEVVGHPKDLPYVAPPGVIGDWDLSDLGEIGGEG